MSESGKFKEGILYRLYEENYIISTHNKYKILIWLVAVVHVCLIAFFAALRVMPLVIFNIFSVVLYLYLRVEIGKKKYVRAYIMTYFEIFLHTILATVLVGWNLGFPLYNLAIVPVSFYISYMTPGFRKAIVCPTILAVTNMIITIFGRLYNYEFGAVYQVESEMAVLGFHTFNSIIAYLTVGIFSFLFLIELRARQVDLIRKNRELDQIANFDSLTGLYNRRSIEPLVREAIEGKAEEERSFCIAIGDVDEFKKINDTFGHNCGDRVLQNIARLLCTTIGNDGLVCRWGGEEFLIVLFLELEPSSVLMEKVRKKIEKSKIEFAHNDIRISVTFGICEYKAGETYEEVIFQADQMLYNGKKRGKNCVSVKK